MQGWREPTVAELVVQKFPGSTTLVSVRGFKAMVRFCRHFGVEEPRGLEEYIWSRSFTFTDAMEGPQASAEHRAPHWIVR